MYWPADNDVALLVVKFVNWVSVLVKDYIIADYNGMFSMECRNWLIMGYTVSGCSRDFWDCDRPQHRSCNNDKNTKQAFWLALWCGMFAARKERSRADEAGCNARW